MPESQGGVVSKIANSSHAEAWNGWEGEIWATHADRYNAMAEGFNDALFTVAAIRETDRVLDIGCGTGRTTLLAAHEAVRSHVVAVDLSQQLLERARAEASRDGLGNIEFLQGDAQVHPFPAGSFDVTISRAALMLFVDLAEGFANIARSLRSGGRIAFTCPGPPDPASDYARATAALRPFMRRLSPAQQGVNSLGDMQRTRGLLQGAGFSDVASPIPRQHSLSRWGVGFSSGGTHGGQLLCATSMTTSLCGHQSTDS